MTEFYCISFINIPCIRRIVSVVVWEMWLFFYLSCSTTHRSVEDWQAGAQPMRHKNDRQKPQKIAVVKVVVVALVGNFRNISDKSSVLSKQKGFASLFFLVGQRKSVQHAQEEPADALRFTPCCELFRSVFKRHSRDFLTSTLLSICSALSGLPKLAILS